MIAPLKEIPSDTSPTPSQAQSEHPWEITVRVPEKPTVCDYGYVTAGQSVGCTKEQLIKEVTSRAPELKFVWTPEFPQPVFPETVAFLTPIFKKRAANEALKTLAWGAAFVAFGIVHALVEDDWRYLYRNFLAVIGAVILVEGAWAHYRTRSFTTEDVATEASTVRFDAWIKQKSISGYTFGVATFLVVVGVGQLLGGTNESIEAAGLVKPAVWQGQSWRLATATLMHVNFLHFWMNFLGLLALARIIEQTIHRALVPVVFFASATCGSIFSLLLYPQTTSVGASGGLMGLVGFLAVAAMVNREKYPPKYLRRLLQAIVFVGVFGAIGFAMIDNGAHLGGLLGGAALGWLFLARQRFEKLKSALARLGVLSLVMIGLTAAIGIWQIFK